MLWKISEHFFEIISELSEILTIMSFTDYKEEIELNDLVILYINFTTVYPVTVKAMTMNKKRTAEVGVVAISK